MVERYAPHYKSKYQYLLFFVECAIITSRWSKKQTQRKNNPPTADTKTKTHVKKQKYLCVRFFLCTCRP
ncbi:MAG: hypothetical protein AUK21_02175 [Parcubacteria group bacterium CG2_30_48_51]|nr:MAG: hypothetical protein AUK21_02175 [Parcubacteria group bacterium CG2_30_48_51]